MIGASVTPGSPDCQIYMVTLIIALVFCAVKGLFWQIGGEGRGVSIIRQTGPQAIQWLVLGASIALGADPLFHAGGVRAEHPPWPRLA